jgi:hypothetical protein
MSAPELDRRGLADRRLLLDRRSGVDESAEATGERRNSERRAGIERRLALQSAADQMETAIGLLMRIAESGALSDEDLRLLDTAMLRLRFAAERLERE